MQLSEDELKNITRMAAAAYTPYQVAFAMGINKDAFTAAITEDNNPISIAYFKGLYSSELAVRESVFQLARAGSSPAQTLTLRMLDETRKNLLINGLAEDEV